MDDEVDTKLSAARTRLILDKSFLGALALRLPLAAAGGCARSGCVRVRVGGGGAGIARFRYLKL